MSDKLLRDIRRHLVVIRSGNATSWAEDNALIDRVDAALSRAEPPAEPTADAAAREACPVCKGIGKVMRSSFVDSSKQIAHSCSICKGSGKLPATTAPAEGVVVPREPTEEIINTIGNCLYLQYKPEHAWMREIAIKVWKLAIAAAKGRG